MRCYRLSARTIKGTNGKTMSQDNVSALDIARSLPGVLRRLPSITRGLYYYSLKNEKRELTLGTLIKTTPDPSAIDRPSCSKIERSPGAS